MNSRRFLWPALGLAMLSLSSCDLPRTYHASDAQRLEAAEANADRAIARSDELEEKISDLETKVDDLESRADDAEANE